MFNTQSWEDDPSWHRTSKELVTLYSELGWTNLMMLLLICTTLFHLSHYNLRNSDDISVRGCTAMYENAFLPERIQDWNSLQVNTKEAITLNTFSSCIETKKQAVSTWYLSETIECQ